MSIRLFINHRPYNELEFDMFDKSMSRIKEYLNTSSIPKTKLFELLNLYGDEMKTEEIQDCFDVLIEKRDLESLPEQFTSEYLYNKVLGFEEVKNDDQ